MVINSSNGGEQLDADEEIDVEGDLIDLAKRISSGFEKLSEDENDEEKLGFLRLDLRFYVNYFFTLENYSWWRISPQHLDLLSDNLTEINKRLWLFSAVPVEYCRLLPNYNWVSVSEEKLLVWKEQLVHNYSVLLNAKPESPPDYVSCKNLVQFITNICRIAIDMLKIREDLDDDEKQLLHASQANLRFLRAFVLLADNEGMGSLLNYILDYTCKVESLLFCIWTGKTRDHLVSALEEGGVNVDKPCSLLIVLDVFKLPKKILLEEEGFFWGDEPTGEVIFPNFVWGYILDCIPEFLNDYFSKDLLCYVSRLIGGDLELEGGIQLLHERLTLLASFLEDLSSDMRLLFVRAAASLGFICVFRFQDSSSEVIKQVKFQLSMLNASLHISGVEVMLMKLMIHEFNFIIFKMSLLKELEDSLKFLRERLTFMEDGYLEDNVLLMSQIEALQCDALSFFKLLNEHENEEDDCKEIDVAFLKLIGTTKLIQAHVSALELLNSGKEFQVEGQHVNLCDKLGFLVELVKNLSDNNVDQILFLLDTGAVAIKVSVLIHISSMDMPEERLKEMGDWHLRRLIADIELLEAELMLNSFLNHDVDVIVPFTNIEMLRDGFRLLRIVLTDSTEQDSAVKELVVFGDELVKKVIPLVSKLFRNRSNKRSLGRINKLFLSCCMLLLFCGMDDLVSDSLQDMIAWETQVKACYLEVRKSLQSTHPPRTDRLGFIDCLVDNLSNLSSSMPALPWMKYQIGRAFKDLKSCRSLLNDILWEHNEDNELDNLVSELTQAAYEVEYVAEAFAIGHSNTWTNRLWISDLIDEIKQTSLKIRDVLAKSNNNGVGNPSGTSDRLLLQPVDNNTTSTNEMVVGMKEQEEKVINQLIRGSTKLGIVSIVGMGGLGKTTLAKKVFDSPSVQHSFDVRAWCCISKVYQKQEILLEILGYVTEVTPEIRKMTDDDLANRLRQLLLGRSYLIVMDDMWDMRAWEELQQSFPKGDKQSRILFTSRISDIASKSGYGYEPCSLDSLSDTQSWELLERKVFDGGSCPLPFREVGWEIAIKCKGLPLAIVVISGLLSTQEMNRERWEQVAANLSSIVVGNSTNVIDLSYRYLPDYLKPCFLYFSAFQEDKTILVSNLIHLWTSEGFIRRRRNDDKNIDDVARDYLQELVRRNLVSVAERTSMGGVKACRLHDILHELCCARAGEENFLHMVKNLGKSNDPIKYEHRRVCIYSSRRNFVESRPSGQCVHSLLFFATDRDYSAFREYDASFISLSFQLLRTLKLDSINIGDSLPDGLELLVHLRFFAVLGTMELIPVSIERLSNLEFFYVKGLRREIWVPHSIWRLRKLRNLHVKYRFTFISIEEILNDKLDNLESLSSVFLPYGETTERILQRLPRLQKLKCIFSESWDSATKSNRFPNLNSLVQLESLKVLYHGRVRHPCVFSYPATLKKLTLSKFRLPWKDMSAIGSLPCLEVLKLLSKAFEGQEWEVESEGFQNLKYLKLESLDIVQWTAPDSFPCLEKLVLQSCKRLEEVPFDFGESPTLQTIQVQWCSSSVAKSVKAIQDEQMETSGRELNVFIREQSSIAHDYSGKKFNIYKLLGR